MDKARLDVPALLARALTAIVVVYVLLLGGTFTGVLLLNAQILSLALLTGGVLIWLGVAWRRPFAHSEAALDGALAVWGGAFALSALSHPSGRVAIAMWWFALYAGVWLLLVDLRQRGLRESWIVDAALIAAVPVMLLAVAQVARWYVAWFALDSVRVAYVPPRPPSTLGNANALGTVLAMLLPLGLVRWYQVRRMPLARVVLSLWVVLALLVLYLTFSRGAWLSAVGGIVVLLTLVSSTRFWRSPRRWWRQRTQQTRWIMAFALAAIVIAGMLAMVATIRAFDTPRRDPGTRLFLWNVAWETVRDYPLVGRGPGTYGLSLLEHWSFPPEHPHAGAHNLVLNVAAELGAVGLIALLVSIIVITWLGWRAVYRAVDPDQRAQRAACAGGLAALGIHSMVDLPLSVPAIVLLALAVMAVMAVDGPRRERRSPVSVHWQRLRFATVFVLWGGVLAGGWWSAAGYAAYVRGEQALADGDFHAGMMTLRDVAAREPELALYHAQHAYSCGLVAAAGDVTCLPEGIAAYQRALDLEPQHAVWWANLAALYWQAEQPGAAIDVLQQAVTYAPDAADFWLALGVYQEAASDDNAAFAAYRQALDAHVEWAYLDFWATTSTRRLARLTSGIAPSPYARARFLMRAGMPDAAIAVLDARIKHDPSQPRPYAQLARVYVVEGDLERAQVYRDAASVLVHTPYGAGWVTVVDAVIARAEGDGRAYVDHMTDAQTLLMPDGTGYTLLYGQDVANFHFWRARIAGMLLPQLPVYGHDPQLTERVGASLAESFPDAE